MITCTGPAVPSPNEFAARTLSSVWIAMITPLAMVWPGKKLRLAAVGGVPGAVNTVIHPYALGPVTAVLRMIACAPAGTVATLRTVGAIVPCAGTAVLRPGFA